MTQTRDQRVVAAYDRDGRPRTASAKLRSRARDLPAMLRRHGLLQVLSFLAAKKKDDGTLAELLCHGIGEALGERIETKAYTRYRDDLAKLSLGEYLRHQEASLVAASWLKLLIEAHPESGEEALAAGETPNADPRGEAS